MPATCEVALAPGGKVKVASAKLLFNSLELPAVNCKVFDATATFRQTQQVTAQTKTKLVLKFAPGTASIRMISKKQTSNNIPQKQAA